MKKKQARLTDDLAEKPLAWLVRFQSRAEVDLITKAATVCGVTKNVFIARSAELIARKCLGEEINSILAGFSVTAAPREKEESAA
jgi:hypothetical protein